MKALKNTILPLVKNFLNKIIMKTRKRLITFYKIEHDKFIPHLEKYGMMCTRTWWSCFKLGLRHIRQGKATFFIIGNSKHKKH